MNITNVEIADYCDDETTCIVSATCCNKEENFHVQTTDGLYRSDLGCWVTADDCGDGIDFDAERFEGFDFSLIIKEAEECVKDRYKIESTDSPSYILKVFKAEGKVEVCEVNHNYINRDTSSYQTEYEVIATFYDKEEALEYIEEESKNE